ncbi:MAG: hypothetical protein ACLQG3_13810 [Terracidiphilus sp.]
MRLSLAAFAAAVPVGMMLTPVCGLTAGAEQAAVPDFIVTAAPAYAPLAELNGQERFPKGAQLLLVHAGKTEPLVAGFAASADANVSFDGQTVLFAGKQSAGDPWQIWELMLKDRSVRKVIATAGDAERPLYLPGGRMVWAQRTAAGFEVQSAEDGHPEKYPVLNPTAGPGVLPLTDMRANAFPADVLRDGRILFEAGYPLGEGSTPEMYLVYADGSGVESVRCDHGRARWSGTQLASGDVIFTHGTSLARFTSPLGHEAPVAAPQGTFAGAIAETASGAWLVSAKTAADTRYAVKAWKPGETAMRTVLARSGEDLVEPVVVAPRGRPNRHPSGLHPWNYANLLALDARVSREGSLKGTPVAVRLETQDGEGRAIAMGTAPVEKDGSFFVQVPGDRPIRFELLDFKGTVLRQEHGWFWARGGEQRICVGCHAGPERAAENRVPDVLMRTTTPVDLTGAKKAAAGQTAGQGGR